MELRHLRHFIAVAEELHFARAAERLGMEQSPLSHSIHNLETELRVKLFHRTTRKTWLTRVGSRFYAEAKRILGDIDDTTASLRDEDDEEPNDLRLALGEDLAADSFTRFLFELEHHRPPIAVEVRELTHTDAVRLVRDGGSDLALTLSGRETDGLRQFKAWGEPLMLVLPIGHACAERDTVSLTEIAAERLAFRVEVGTGSRGEFGPGFSKRNDCLCRRLQREGRQPVRRRGHATSAGFAAAARV